MTHLEMASLPLPVSTCRRFRLRPTLPPLHSLEAQSHHLLLSRNPHLGGATFAPRDKNHRKVAPIVHHSRFITLVEVMTTNRGFADLQTNIALVVEEIFDIVRCNQSFVLVSYCPFASG